MTKNIREMLFPLIIICHVCGLKIIKYPIGDVRQWFSFLYILLIWITYNFIGIIMHILAYIQYKNLFSIEYYVCIGLHSFAVLISIAFGIYYDKIFRSCINRLIIVDNTLEKLGTTMNYYKFKMRILWAILGWSAIILLITSLESLYFNENIHILTVTLIPFVRNYCGYIAFIGDLLIVVLLRYIELKFVQINEYVEILLERDNRDRLKLPWTHSTLRLYKFRFSKASNNKCVVKGNEIWIVMHLHLELCKISRKIDTIFGTQMTLGIGCYFALITAISNNIFHIIFKKYDTRTHQILFIVVILTWLSIYIFRLFLINYICERVSTKANKTGDFINRFSYVTCDIEIRENILQFLLQISLSPLKFYGLGLFQFGFKFLYEFLASVLTVLVIYTQAFTNN